MRRSLTIIIIAAGLSVLTFWFSNWVVRKNRDIMIKTAKDESILKITHSTHLIAQFLKERKNVVGTIASWINPFWVISPDAFKLDIIENINKFLKKYPGIDSIHFLNRQGTIAWGVPLSKSMEGVKFFKDLPAPERYLELFEKAKESKKTHLSLLKITEFNPKTEKLSSSEMLLIISPIYRNDTYLGSLLAIMRIDTIGRRFFPPSSGRLSDLWMIMDNRGKPLYANTRAAGFLKCSKSISEDIQNSNPYHSEIISCLKDVKTGHPYLVSWSKLPICKQKSLYLVVACPLGQIESETQFWLWQIRGIASVIIAIMVFTAIFLLISFQRSEVRLDALNQKYRDLLDNLLVGAFTFDASTGKIDYINQRACQILGYQPEELIGKDRLTFAYDKEKEEIDRLSGQRMRGQRQAETYRAHMVHRSGRVIDVEIFASPVFGENGEIQSVRVMFTDITRQLEMEREIQRHTKHLEELVGKRTYALRESEALYRSIFETSLAIIYIHQDDKFRLMNQAGMEFFGFKDREEMLRANVWDTVPPGEREKRRQNAIRRMAGEPVPSKYESLVINKDGEIRVVECNFQRIIYKGEIAVLAILFDISEKKKLEAEMAHADRLKSMGQLATGVAHDFNNILSAILGRAQLLKEHPEDKELVVSSSRLIEQAVEQGVNAIRRIQEITRVRQDKPVSEPLPIHLLIDDAIEITRFAWKDQAQKNGITIRIEKKIKHGELLFPAELREAFMNLILNAVDAMPKGGTLTIETGLREFGPDRKSLEVIFEDTGQGMPPDVLRHVLEPFYTTKGKRGTGLGLSIVSETISKMGGTVKIESEEGKGTRVILNIPVQTDLKGRDTGKQPDGPAPKQKKKGDLLVVDDEPALTGIFKDLFSSHDIAIITANSGEEALKRFRESPERFALILTDLGMPGMNGWELSRKIREISTEIPIVLMTGWGLEISEEERIRAHVSEIISKPLTIKTILETVARYVRL